MTLPKPVTRSVKDLTLLAQGGSRFIYQHPERPDEIIKVLKMPRTRSGSRWQRWYHERKYQFKMQRFLREVREYIWVSVRQDDPIQDHVPAFTELVMTDRGFGMATQKLSVDGDQLAPTLSSLLKSHQFTRAHAEALQTFAENLVASPVVVGDLNAKNMVFVPEVAHRWRCFLVDGMGDSTFFPVQHWRPSLNRWQKRRVMHHWLQRAGVLR